MMVRMPLSPPIEAEAAISTSKETGDSSFSDTDSGSSKENAFVNGSNRKSMNAVSLNDHVLSNQQKISEGGFNLQDSPAELPIDMPSSVDLHLKIYDDSAQTNSLASIDEADFTRTTAVEEVGLAPMDVLSTNNDSFSISSKVKRRKKGQFRVRKGRLVRDATIDDVGFCGRGLSLPNGQYETILVRRAIRKLDDYNANNLESTQILRNPPTSSSANNPEPNEIYGDISLGMKLSVLDGKVIVHHLKTLADGRASPAQLAGVISPGDVLISVNGRSLINLPLDSLMNGLDPLSKPDATGCYQRKLKLRFAIGMGLKLLQASEHAEQQNDDQLKISRAEVGNDIARDMLALFPMVDQLSGMPLFEEQQRWSSQLNEKTTTDKKDLTPKIESSTEIQSFKNSKQFSVHDLISQNLASFTTKDRNRFLKEFYEWNNNFSTFKLPEFDHDNQQAPDSVSVSPNLQELLDIGRKAILGASVLSKQMEDVDEGKDVRSFRSLSTTLSLYSRTSHRRKRVLDNTATLFRNTPLEEEDEDMDQSKFDDDVANGDKSISDDGEKADRDELLLGLAAKDDVWKKQVIDFLGRAASNNEGINNPTLVQPPTAESDDIFSALSNEFGNFLFGENMRLLLPSQGQPRSLPSEEVTAVLYDLAIKISSSIPDNIVPASDYNRSTFALLNGTKKPSAESDVFLATRFLLDEALPAWLKSFCPLPWEHRRLLWPLENNLIRGGSTAASSISDEFTLETAFTGLGASSSNRLNDIAAIVEDREMNTETRRETCFLITFYFTQALLPKLKDCESSENLDKNKVLDNIIVFLGEYGSYLRLDTCLAYAALLHADTVMDLLLGIAKYDPRHREAIKLITKSNQLVFYEPTMLSAVIQRLTQINESKSTERRMKLIELCAAAYPDIRPWQVKKACSSVTESSSTTGLSKLYYTYLSYLMHPSEGHESARRDRTLVSEWCELALIDSLSSDEKASRRRNFFVVASRASREYLSYVRDPVVLLKLSMAMNEYDLALDIAEEILDDKDLSKDAKLISSILAQIRFVGIHTLDTNESIDSSAANTFKRILGLFKKDAIRKFENVSSELIVFIDHRSRTATGRTVKPKLFEIVDFFAREANPHDLLQALVRWTPSDLNEHIYPILQLLLTRGAMEVSGFELSKSRLRLRQSRNYVGHEDASLSLTVNRSECDDRNIWHRMSLGLLPIEK